jgi:hypothetical protein
MARTRSLGEVARHASIGASATGAGSGAVLLYVLKSFPDDRPWKQLLLYCAPTVSLAVRRAVLWLVAVLGEYVSRKLEYQQKVFAYKSAMAQLNRKEQELHNLEARGDLSAAARERIVKELEKINEIRIEEVRKIGP